MQPRTPKYRRHKPTGQAVVTLNGRDIYLGKHGTPESRAEYDRLIAEWLSNGRRMVRKGPEAEAGDLSVAELIVAYMVHADAYYRKNGEPTSEPANIRFAFRPLRRLYGHTAAKDFGPLALQAVRDAMIETGLCRNEVNKRVRRVIRMFAWGVSKEMLPPSAHHALKSVTGLRKGNFGVRESSPVRPVPVPHIEAVKPFVARQVWAMIELQRYAGMRPGEVCRMRTIDLDVSGSVWTYAPGRHKTEHHDVERVVFLGPKAQEILRPWLRTDLHAYLFSPREAVQEFHAQRTAARKTRVQPSQLARKRLARPKRPVKEFYSATSYAHAIMDACDRAFPHPELVELKGNERSRENRAGIRAWKCLHEDELTAWQKAHRWHPHQLRHNAGTYLRSVFGPDVARTVLGQKTLAAAQIYCEADLDKAREAMGKVG